MASIRKMFPVVRKTSQLFTPEPDVGRLEHEVEVLVRKLSANPAIES